MSAVSLAPDFCPAMLIAPLDQQLLRITGPDRALYLHGQVTADITGLAAGEATLAAHCDAKGKVLDVPTIFADNETLYWLSDASVIADSQTELKKYGVFSKVEINREEQLIVVGLAGKNVPDHLPTKGLLHKLPGALPRYLWLTEAAALSDYQTQVEAVIGNAQDWLALQTDAGEVHFSQALRGEFIPQMLNLQMLEAISFSKGCYRGQETVARAKYRGINKKALFLIEGKADICPVAGASLERELDGNWRNIGSVLQAVCFDTGVQRLLAVLPKDSDSEMQLRLSDNEHSHYQLRPLPYELTE